LMSLKRIIFIATLSGLAVLTGCSKRVPGPSSQPVKTVFGASIPDRPVSVGEELYALKLPSAKSGELIVSTKDWMELSEQLFEAGEMMDTTAKDRLIRMAHRLSESFYKLRQSSTQMVGTTRPPGNPYVEQAFHYAHPELIAKYNNTFDKAGGKVAEAASSVRLGIASQSCLPKPHDVIAMIGDGLQQFKSSLITKKSDPIDSSDFLLDKIREAIDQDFMKSLSTLRDSLVHQPQETAAAYLVKLKRTLNQFPAVPDSEKKGIEEGLDRGLRIAQQIDEIKDSSGALALLIDLWFAKQIRHEFPQGVRDLFGRLSDAQLIALVTQNKPTVLPANHWASVPAKKGCQPLNDHEIVALTNKNSGHMLGSSDWKTLQAIREREVQQLLSQDAVKRFAAKLASKQPGNTDEALAVLVRNWLNLDTRATMPDELREALGGFTNEELMGMRDQTTFKLYTRLYLKAGYSRSVILSSLEAYDGAKNPADGVKNFKNMMNAKIIKTVQDGISAALLPVALNLKHHLKAHLTQALQAKKAEGQKTAGESFHQFARYYISKWIFGVNEIKKSGETDNEKEENLIIERYPFPIMEKRQVHLIERGGTWSAVETPDETTAEILGLALSNSAHRIETMERFNDVNPVSPKALAVAFQAVCKMSIMMGYAGYDAKPVDSLAVAFTPGHAGEKLDIRKYDPAQVTFAIPDVVKIKERYKLDRTTEEGATASVTGQMELLRGFVKMMKFLKPWKTNAFDTGLGSLRLDEAPDMSVFSKDKLFQLSFGLAGFVALNVKARMVGLVSQDHRLVPAHRLPPNIMDFPAIGAVVTDLKGSDAGDPPVTSQGLARAMIAIAQFYEATSDLNQSNDATVIGALPDVEKAKALVRKLLMGMAVFASSHLLQTDGGFAVSYDFGKQKASTEPRKLEDQLLMQEAMMVVGNLLDTDVIRFRALDNYFFLNSRMWNSNLGFYGQVEGEKTARVRLVSVVRALKNLQLLKPLLQRQYLTHSPNVSVSLQQLHRLESFWPERFLSQDILRLPPIYQVLDFSL
jgi:hypothetical protein